MNKIEQTQTNTERTKGKETKIKGSGKKKSVALALSSAPGKDWMTLVSKDHPFLYFFLSLFWVLVVPLAATAQTYTLNAALHGTTKTTCAGTFYDSGGSGGSYSSNQDYSVVFCSATGERLKLDFSAFDTEAGHDFLYIYDGANTAASQVPGSPFSGTASPGSVVSSGTCLTVRFTSDYSVNKTGWAATLSCVPFASNCTCPGNLLTNNNFEGGTLTGWTLNGSAASTFPTGLDACGFKSLKLARVSGTGLLDPAAWQQVGGVVPGKTYTLSFDAGVHANSFLQRVYLRFYNSAGTLLSGDYLEVNHNVDTNGKLQSYSFTTVAPAGSTYLRVEAALNGDCLYLDNLCLVNSSCASPIFNFQNPYLLSGTANTPGAVYRFTNVLPGVNANVTLVSRSHSDVSIFTMDEPEVNYGGYESAFQPHIDYNWINGGGSYDPAGEKSITFKFDFLDASTGAPKIIPRLNMTGLDIDGSTDEVREFMITSGFQLYEIQSPTTLTLSGALKAKGDLATQDGIDEAALNAMISFVFENKSTVTVTYGGDWNGSTWGFGDTGPGNSDEKRLNSLYFKCYDFNSAVACPIISVSGGAAVCSGASAVLQASVSGGAGTCSVQWQTSSDNVNWTNIAGATGLSYTTPALTATRYYRATYNCTAFAECGTLYSNVQSVNVGTPPPAPLVAITNAVCGNTAGTIVFQNADGYYTSVDNSAPSWEKSTYTTIAGGKHTVCLSLPGCTSCVEVFVGGAVPVVTISETDQACSPNDNSVYPGGAANLTAAATGGVSATFKIGSVSSGQCLDIISGSTVQGTNVVQNLCLLAVNQKWVFIPVTTGVPVSAIANGRYYIQNRNSGQYLWPEGAGIANGTAVEQNHFQNLLAQWDVASLGSGQFSITNAQSGKALEIASGSILPGAAAQLAQPGGAAKQKFTIVPEDNFTYAWSNGLGSGATKTVTPAVTTTYTVTATDAFGCTATATIIISVSTVNCSENCTDGWDNDGDGLTDCEDPECASAGICDEICDNGIDDDGDGLVDCADSFCNHDLAVNAGADAILCNGTSGNLVATATGGTAPHTFSWSNGLGTGASKTVSPAVTTVYTVTVTDANGCTATDQVSVQVITPATVSVSGDPTICAGSSTILTATATSGVAPYTFDWSDGLGAGNNKTVSPIATTAYAVTVTAANGCTSSAQVMVYVNPTPTVFAGADLGICAGGSIGISASASGGTAPYTYAWSNGLGSGANKTVSPAFSSTYTVTATSANGCTATDQVLVNVGSLPSVNAGADQTICFGKSANLTAFAAGGSTPYTYSWNNLLGNGASKTVSPLVTTTYAVTVTGNDGCAASDQVIVTVGICPELCFNGIDDDGDGLVDCADPDCATTVDVGGDVSICEGTSKTLTASATGGNGTYLFTWNNGLGVGASKTVSPSVTTTYAVTVTSGLSCSATDQVLVTVSACPEDCTNGIDDDGDGLVDCADPDCVAVAAPALADDVYTTCPGLTYSERVTYNDGNLQSPVFSIAAPPSYGTVSIDWTGKFIYTPFAAQCMTDVFTYQVCNGSGCCATATVTIHFGDQLPPTLLNVPDDVTIGCDDEVPLPPQVVGFDACPGIFIDFSEESTAGAGGACNSYTITRTWTTTDLCGNYATDHQEITVLDLSAPEIYRVYTLANGKRLVAGISQQATQSWKQVPFPIKFQTKPLVFTQIVSNNEAEAAIVRHRNTTTQGFELRLREQELSQGNHSPEMVAWLAIEPGALEGELEADDLMGLTSTWQGLTFGEVFAGTPGFIAALQTTNDTDPVGVRQRNLVGGSVEVVLQEETSKDAEVAHGAETLGYLALKPNLFLFDEKDDFVGESGAIQLTNAWVTVHLTKEYTKPVVLMGGLSNVDGSPALLRVRNVTATSFEARVQEWDYLDGGHAAETATWFVVEGSIPAGSDHYCPGASTKLEPGGNIFAFDNCDNLIDFQHTESSAVSADGFLTTRTWSVTDDCGNQLVINRIDTCDIAAVKVKTMLAGPLLSNGNNPLMRDDLRQKSLIPLEEPFSNIPAYDYVATQISNGAGNGNENVTVDGKVTICHKPGTNAEHTLEVSPSAVAAHLAHGDVLGTCGGGGGGIPPVAAAAEFVTIADGDWQSALTWQGGVAPPTGILNNKSILIKHQVTVQGTTSLTLQGNSQLWVLAGGSLTLTNGSLTIQDASVTLEDAALTVAGAGNLVVDHASGRLFVLNSKVEVGLHFTNNSGQRWLENVCLYVGGEYRNYGTDSLLHTCATVELKVANYLGGKLYLEQSKVKVELGNFDNLLGSTLSGEDVSIWLPNGSLTNLGSWTANLDEYCVVGSVPLLGILFPPSENCASIPAVFDLCECTGESLGYQGVATAANTANTFTHSGKLNPALLTVTGQNALVDWVLVEIRNPANLEEILAYSTGAVQRDGDVVSEGGDSVLYFTGLKEGNYYVSIRHRNHLGLLTEVPMPLSFSNPPLVDFTDPALKLKGAAAAGKTINDKRVMWAGDFNVDGRVIYQGPYNDIFSLFSRVLSESGNVNFLANYIVPSYDLNDLNLDGKVIYQGPNNDRATLLLHTIMSHPGNVALLGNYIAVDWLP